EFNPPFAVGELLLEFPQAAADGFAVGFTEEMLAKKHLRMRDGAAHVIGHQPFVKQMIFACRIAQYPFVQRDALVPKSRHASVPAEACSAADSAAMSFTTSVPVPSLVNTSSSRLSGTL